MDTISKSIGELSAREIRGLVRNKYSEVALHPNSKHRFRVGKNYAVELGYPQQVPGSLSERLAEAFTGVSSYLSRFERFDKGAVVLELGSGGGLDTALLSQNVGPSGKVIGLDLSLTMAQRAVQSLAEVQASNVHCHQAIAEELPIRDSSVDWVVSNGIFNLSPEKEKILEEIYRVLKPGGRVLCSEIVLHREPTPEERFNEDDWFK